MPAIEPHMKQLTTWQRDIPPTLTPNVRPYFSPSGDIIFLFVGLFFTGCIWRNGSFLRVFPTAASEE